MKWILLVSVILNVILAWQLWDKQFHEVREERLIIETHAPQKAHDSRFIETRGKLISPDTPQEGSDKEEKLFGDIPTEEELITNSQEIMEKIEVKKNDFMRQELGLSPEVIARFGQLKEKFYQDSSKIPKPGRMELTIKERRKLLDLEEDFLRNAENLFGSSNWKKYQKFRERHNKKTFEMRNDPSGDLPMHNGSPSDFYMQL